MVDKKDGKDKPEAGVEKAAPIEKKEGEPKEETLLESLDDKQQAEKEYQENIKRLEKSAEDFLKEVELEKVKEGLAVERIKIEPFQPTLTLEKQKELDQKRGFLDSAKDKLRKAFFKLRFIKNPEKLLHLIHYLEDKIVDTEAEYIEVEESEVEQKTDQYQEQGYRVTTSIPAYQDKAELRLEKDIPYEFSLNQAKKLSQLLNQANDPIEILERLKRLGFRHNTYTFTLDNHFEALRSFVASPEVGTLLKKLEQIGVGGYYYFDKNCPVKKVTETGSWIGAGTIEEVILSLAKRDARENVLTPKIQQTLKAITRMMEKPLDLGQIEYYLDIAEDKEGLNFLLFLSVYLPKTKFGSAQMIRNFQMLKKQDLIKPLLHLGQKNISLPPLYELFTYRGDREEDARKIIRDLEYFISSPRLEEFFKDKEPSDFAVKVSRLLGLRVSLHKKEIDKFRQLREEPESLAVLELLRNLKINLTRYEWDTVLRILLV